MMGLPSSSAILNEEEKLARHILVDCRGWQELDNRAVARRVRNNYHADVVRRAFHLLADGGIVSAVTKRSRRGFPTVRITKRSWDAIQHGESEQARILLKRLRVNRDAFD